MEIHIRVVGILFSSLAAIHVIFPRYFDWKNGLKSLSLVNRQMMMVHTFFIAFVVFLMGLLCITSAQELEDTELGRRVALGLGVFWTTRLLVQLFVYSSELWRGKKFETIVHIIFSLFWMYASAIFLMIALL